MTEPNPTRSPGHETCHHGWYGMACDTFEILLTRSGNRCEFCRTPAAETPRGLLVIDHDGRYDTTAVRGLLCDACNAHWRRVDARERPIGERERDYLRYAWFLTADQHAQRRPLKTHQHMDWPLWERLGQLVGSSRSAVVRELVAWYIGTPGAELPERPGAVPTEETAIAVIAEEPMDFYADLKPAAPPKHSAAPGATPLRNIRLADSIYHPATAVAALRGETFTDLVRSALTALVDEHRAALDAARAATRPCAQAGCGRPIYAIRDRWFHLDSWVPACDPAAPKVLAEPRLGDLVA